MSTRGSRVFRGLIVAFVSLLVAAVAHIAGGGQIGMVGFALALAFSSIACVGLAGRRISSLRVGVAVLISQGTFHLLFGIGSRPLPTSVGHHLGMTMAGMGDPDSVSRLGEASPASVASMPENGWMLVAHAAAAILTIAALLKGERTFWMLAEWVAYALTSAIEAFVPVSITRRCAPVPTGELRAPGSRFLVAGTRHRGPPRTVAST